MNRGRWILLAGPAAIFFAIWAWLVFAIESPQQWNSTPGSGGSASTHEFPADQEPILNVFPPSVADQCAPGTGKFVIFTRQRVGKDLPSMAQAWECIPSRPEVPITKRVEFCYSGWNPTMLLDFLPDAKSWGMYPRYVRLQVDSRDKMYSVNLYDADYRTWNVRCIWQGGILNAFGVFRGSIFCHWRESNKWLMIDSTNGEINNQLCSVSLAMAHRLD